MTAKEEKELLKLCAKAMGFVYKSEVEGEVRNTDWNPLTSSADCFEMETELYLRPGINGIFAQTGFPAGNVLVPIADYNGDKNAARRMASCRAAAEIGRGKWEMEMKSKAWHEGYDVCRVESIWAKNPYDEKDQPSEHAAWEEGYEAYMLKGEKNE